MQFSSLQQKSPLVTENCQCRLMATSKDPQTLPNEKTCHLHLAYLSYNGKQHSMMQCTRPLNSKTNNRIVKIKELEK